MQSTRSIHMTTPTRKHRCCRPTGCRGQPVEELARRVRNAVAGLDGVELVAAERARRHHDARDDTRNGPAELPEWRPARRRRFGTSSLRDKIYCRLDTVPYRAVRDTRDVEASRSLDLTQSTS